MDLQKAFIELWCSMWQRYVRITCKAGKAVVGCAVYQGPALIAFLFAYANRRADRRGATGGSVDRDVCRRHCHL